MLKCIVVVGRTASVALITNVHSIPERLSYPDNSMFYWIFSGSQFGTLNASFGIISDCSFYVRPDKILFGCPICLVC